MRTEFYVTEDLHFSVAVLHKKLRLVQVAWKMLVELEQNIQLSGVCEQAAALLLRTSPNDRYWGTGRLLNKRLSRNWTFRRIDRFERGLVMNKIQNGRCLIVTRSYLSLLVTPLSDRNLKSQSSVVEVMQQWAGTKSCRRWWCFDRWLATRGCWARFWGT